MNEQSIIKMLKLNFPYLAKYLSIENNNIKVSLLWDDHTSAMMFCKQLGSQICQLITINHYIWVRYLDGSDESAQRYCVFPPHQAPALSNKGGQRHD